MGIISIFLRLMVAHQIADFPLQTNWVFRMRQKYSWGSLVHVGIHFIVTAIILLPFAASWQYWACLGVLSITHYLIDLMRKPHIWLFLLDQALHTIVLLGLAYSLKDAVPSLLPQFILNYWLVDIYWIWVLALLLSTFAATILLYFIKMTWRHDYNQRGIFGFEKYHGAMIRFLTFILVAVSVCFKLYYLTPLVLTFPLAHLIYIDRLRGEKPHHRDVHISDVILGALIAAALGIWAGLISS